VRARERERKRGRVFVSVKRERETEREAIPQASTFQQRNSLNLSSTLLFEFQIHGKKLSSKKIP